MSDETGKMHWMPWYPDDVRCDPAVRACSMAAQGFWMHLLGYMWKHSPRRGYLLLADGSKPTEADLARIFAAELRQICRWIAEILQQKCASQNADGVLYCRRMVRDEEARNNKSKGGKASGRKRAQKAAGNVGPIFEQNGQQSAQQPLVSSLSLISEEERVQREEAPASSPRTAVPRTNSRPPPPWSATPSGLPDDARPDPDFDAFEFVAAYNDACVGRMRRWGSTLGPGLWLHVREQERPLEWWRALFRRAAQTPWFRGEVTGFYGTLELVIRHREKIMLGGFDEKSPTGPPKPREPPQPEIYVPKPYKTAARVASKESDS